MRALVLMVVLALTGCADDATPAAEVAAASLGTLVGVVVDETIQPVEGATIDAVRSVSVPLQTVTDAEGRFVLAGIEPGTYGVTVTAPGHIEVVTTATVRADVEDPEHITITIQQERSIRPYVKAIHWQGILGCGTSGSNLCSAPEQGTGMDLIPEDSVRLFWDEVVGEGLVPQFVQVEVVWEPNLPHFDTLNLLLGSSTPTSWQQFQYEHRYETQIGTSPIVNTLNATILSEDQIGVERGLVLELYGGGYDPDNVGVAVDQRFDAFIHLFYHHLPPAGWQFTVDGAPPPPR